MATITKFEDLEIWKLAREQVKSFNDLIYQTTLRNDYPLRNQMNNSSGSVMDCIAEGFDRSGNAEFKHFLTIAKGSNGEYRSQLYRSLDRKHISIKKFEILYSNNITIGNKIMRLMQYLQNSDFTGQRNKKTVSSY